MQQGNGAGESIPTTADQSPSVYMSIPSKAQFGHAVVNLSWMHARFVGSHVLGNAQEWGRRVNQLLQTTAIQTTSSINNCSTAHSVKDFALLNLSQ